MIFKSKIKWAVLLGLVLSLFSLLVHLLLAKYSTSELVQYSAILGLSEDFTTKFEKQGIRYRKLWGSVKPLESLQLYSNPRSKYPEKNRSTSPSQFLLMTWKQFSDKQQKNKKKLIKPPKKSNKGKEFSMVVR